LKRYHIFRNYTIEYLFDNQEITYGGYGDIKSIPKSDNYIWFYQLPVHANPNTIVEELKSYLLALEIIVSKIDSNSDLLLFSIFPVSNVEYITQDNSVSEAIANYNGFLRALGEMNKNIKVLYISSFFRSIPGNDYIDWKYFYSSFILINPKYTKLFRLWFIRQLDAIQLIRKKCIVLDLDNTLWSGVLGEDGVNGIKLGNTYPGNAFKAFQQNLLQLTKYGIILAICSKNNETDVLDLWEKNPEMILKKDHFVSWRINWENKAENIIEIAKELNIGLNSIVFIDDNPSERELVQLVAPEVIVPTFPSQPYNLQRFFKLIVDQYFQTYAITNEDLSKQAQYKANKERERFREVTTSYSAYLRGLKLKVQVYEAEDAEVVRISQLTQKTNQFNLTTKRCSENEIREYVNGTTHRVFVLKVRDKFGDNGITGSCVVNLQDNNASIEIFLLSCRILGKGIESVFLSIVLNKLFREEVLNFTASFIRSEKNDQTEKFYDGIGFKILEMKKKEKIYSLRLTAALPYDRTIYEIYEGK
jgi:FkbH-like protein